MKQSSRWKLSVCMLFFAFLLPCQAMAEDEVTFNFNNADIRSVIKFVSDFTGKNFLVDNRVKGKVTIISPRALPSEAAYQVFLSILEVNGFAAVPGENVTKIIPLALSKQKGIKVKFNGDFASGDELVTQVVPLKFAQAQQLVAVLRPIVATTGNITAYAPANMLLITDSASNIRRILDIISALDISEAVGVKLIRLKYASADKLAKILTEMFAGSSSPTAPRAGQLAGLGSAGGASAVKVTAYSPENMLIIVAPNAEIAAIASLIKKLDLPPQADAGLLQVRYLKNANAEDVAKVLNEMVSGTAQQTSPLAGQSAVGKKAASKVLFTGKVKIVADPATNALLITADPSDRESLNKIIDKLDIRRLQIFMEALLVEVSASRAQDFGVEWSALSDFTQPGRKAIGGTSFTNQAGVNINTVAANPITGAGSGLLVGVVDGTITFGGVEFANLGALLRALESDTNTNVLSTPNLLTMDNEEAEIIIGQNVPFLTGSFSQSTGTGGTVNPFQTIQRQDIGLTLRVTPQISEGDTVRLEIYQEISSIAPGVTGASDIITNKRSVKTVVLARDKQMIVLGGLIEEQDTEKVQKVPCLGSIPLLGEPFKYTELSKDKKNLMLFLRPHIINTARDIETITQEKYLNMKKIQDEQSSDATLLFPRDNPKLPDQINPANQTEPLEEPANNQSKPESQAP